MLDLVSIKREYGEPINHKMIDNALAQWQGIEVSLDAQRLADMTVANFRELFEA